MLTGQQLRFSEANIPFEAEAGTSVTMQTLVATEGSSQESTKPNRAFSASNSKPTTEGNTERVGGRRGDCWISRASLYFLFWHPFPDPEPVFSPHKHQMALIRSVCETFPVMTDARLRANGLGNLGELHKKIRAKETGRGSSEAPFPPFCSQSTCFTPSTRMGPSRWNSVVGLPGVERRGFPAI